MAGFYQIDSGRYNMCHEVTRLSQSNLVFVWIPFYPNKTSTLRTSPLLPNWPNVCWKEHWLAI